ncbi:cleft lip and palate associated transmembrane protein [Lobosporangium transversale]|uniref:Cleft lip and palate associated transmembrane protein n=1 Tax=Lobosporangium transversale TaxID=64571 RepID=A0A1Y2GU08_9FUNG|nr:cleft lip and palate associated transmembrane protein [Lobosporangium transversale]ORZ23729.1 cleft lip and palate associated transmembrane protein [Lobosporangium transversale]|eukprot:XP_021883543.1 cleft lip and palate associated transmembrane protein [Lobosporangium transversale]
MNGPDGVQQIKFNAASGPFPDKLYPLWTPGIKADMFVYLSEEPNFSDFNNKDSLVWRSNDIELGDWSEDRVVDLSIIPSKHVQNNGTLFAHIYFAKQPAILDPTAPGFSVDNRVYTRKMLTRYFTKKKELKVKKLIGGNNQETEPEKSAVEEETPASGTAIVSYWHQNLTLTVLSDRSVIPYSAVPPELRDIYQLESTGLRDQHGNGFVLPALWVNDFWLLKEQMFPINETVKELPLRINFYPISYMKLQMYASMDVGMKRQSGMMGSTGSELDEFKRMLIETNPWLLLLTVVVSVLHSAFEMLAFKNDIAFWKDKKGTAGLSVRAIFLDIAQQIIVFAYLMDNNQDTSYMILIGQGVGLAIELWKVKKALKVDIVPATTGILPYRLHFNTSEPLTDLESKTKEYDQEAFKYLSWAAFPLLACYAIYSLLYQEHKSWYSFVVSTLVGFVYTFGFIKMTPQLFINYKLKSVAHMPFRTMMYKSLNTFIDDLFSFIIKMPMMHRLACLRDDVVFFVYLYQRWIYRTDHSRANEFGQVGEEETPKEATEIEAKEESKKDK